MEMFKCSSCPATIEADDLDDLMSKGWHVLYAGSLEEGSETIVCARCFDRGMTISPSVSDPPS